MIPRREHKKRPGKAGEQRARHIGYQRFYDAHKALQEGATEVTVEAFGVEYTLEWYEVPEYEDGYGYASSRQMRGLVIVKLNKGVVLAEIWGWNFNTYRLDLERAYYLTNKTRTTPARSLGVNMVLAHVKSIRFLREIQDGKFKSACTPYLAKP